jgi:hypothetical protein
MSDDTLAVLALVVPAGLAALGYVGKELWRSLRERSAELRARRARLHQLQALLRASRAVFVVQNLQAQRLAERLLRSQPDKAPEEPGYERLFAAHYETFDEDDKDLHGLIRVYTERGLHPLNQAMLRWLQEDTDHRTPDGKSGKEAELSELLNQLDAHLLLWLAKYEAWIPNRPDHALVYLADEERHGLGFPRKIDEAISAVLQPETRRRAATSPRP